jgi:hypothetical protein
MSKRVAMMVMVLLVCPLTGQAFEEGCEPLGCGHEVRKLKERVQKLEWEVRVGGRDEADERHDAEIRRRIRERAHPPRTDAEVERQRREWNLYQWGRGQ